jgi:zinc transport system substrate-binding protein
MKKNRKVLIGIATTCCLIVIIFIYYKGFNYKSEEIDINAEADKKTVFTSIIPQEYFVEKIGGDRVEVQALVKPGSSPATYEPTPLQMAALSEADLFLCIGVPFENALIPKIETSTKGIRIVKTQKEIKLRRMKVHYHQSDTPEEHQDADQEHDKHEGHHETDGTDPHIWLNPRLVKIQAQNIANTLIEIDPVGKTTYENNLAVFLEDLDALDAHLVETMAPVKGETFMVFHPAWGYFADAYGLEQEPVEIEGKEPSARQLTRIIEMAKDQGVRVIFVQPQFNMESATRVAEAIDGVVVPIDPLARDYVDNLKKVAEAVREKLKKQENNSDKL